MCVALLTSDVVSWKTTMLEQTKAIECMCMSCVLESYMNVVHLFVWGFIPCYIDI